MYQQCFFSFWVCHIFYVMCIVFPSKPDRCQFFVLFFYYTLGIDINQHLYGKLLPFETSWTYTSSYHLAVIGIYIPELVLVQQPLLQGEPGYGWSWGGGECSCPHIAWVNIYHDLLLCILSSTDDLRDYCMHQSGYIELQRIRRQSLPGFYSDVP